MYKPNQKVLCIKEEKVIGMSLIIGKVYETVARIDGIWIKNFFVRIQSPDGKVTTYGEKYFIPHGPTHKNLPDRTGK